MLLIGTLIASWVGTTGASMLLIHPLLRANANRRHKSHTVIFFIFLVSNVGGALTPLGDPPLFLGFLSGVPFFWTLKLLPHMAVLAVFLLLMYWLIEHRYYRQEIDEHHGRLLVDSNPEPVRVVGLRNLPLLLVIVFAVLLSGIFKWGAADVGGVHVPWQNIGRDVLLIVAGLTSLRITPRALRSANSFTWEPIREVAILFSAIFMTIIPALAILNAGSEGALGFLIGTLEHPWHYFWLCGGLSAFLDNAPTYLTFFNSVLGKFYEGMPKGESVPLLIEEHALLLEAISAGAVFMGAMTYIGNAPNFMVRSIAEERGVNMPSFFGYLARWSLLFVIPGLVLVTLIFFR
jgi:Na+/H+ antiporter NhaD/arsenite permease-like protein